MIYVVGGKWVVEDLNSANKTFLNDNVIHKAELNDDDVVRIADFSIEVIEFGFVYDVVIEKCLVGSFGGLPGLRAKTAVSMRLMV